MNQSSVEKNGWVPQIATSGRPGGRPGQLDRRRRRVGPVLGELHHVGAGHLAQERLGGLQLQMLGGRLKLIPVARSAAETASTTGAYAVPERDRAQPHAVLDVLVAVQVLDPGALAADEDRRHALRVLVRPPGVGVRTAGHQLVQARLRRVRPGELGAAARGPAASGRVMRLADLPVRSRRTLVAKNALRVPAAGLDAPQPHQPEEQLVVPPVPVGLAGESRSAARPCARAFGVRGRRSGSGGEVGVPLGDLVVQDQGVAPDRAWPAPDQPVVLVGVVERGAKTTSGRLRAATSSSASLTSPSARAAGRRADPRRRPRARGRSGAGGRASPHAPPCPSAPPPDTGLGARGSPSSVPPQPISMSSGCAPRQSTFNGPSDTLNAINASPSQLIGATTLMDRRGSWHRLALVSPIKGISPHEDTGRVRGAP